MPKPLVAIAVIFAIALLGGYAILQPSESAPHYRELRISMPGITLDGQRITGIKNSDIEKRAQSKGADLFLFEALSRPKHGTKELPEAEDRHQSVREILRVAIAPDVPFRIIRRELLAAQQAEHVVIQLRIKHCSDNIRMFIPFLSASNKRQKPRKIAIAEIDIKPNARLR